MQIDYLEKIAATNVHFKDGSNWGRKKEKDLTIKRNWGIWTGFKVHEFIVKLELIRIIDYIFF